MAFALIFDGKVVQIEAAKFPVSTSLEWVNITNVSPTPLVGWLYDGANFSAPIVVLPPVLTDDEVYDRIIKTEKVFKGYVLAINDGSIIPGSNMTGAALKAAVKAKM